MRILSVALVAFLVIGCGSDGGGTMGGLPSPAEQEAARAKCETLKVTYCARVIECGVMATQKECGDAFSVGIDCNRAVAVSTSYPACVQALPTFSCAVLDGGRQLPASCMGSILLPP